VSINLTRFYYDIDDEKRTGLLNQQVFDDVETIEADAFELGLQSKDIEYIRVDL
jgi:hypothetical protein